MSTPGTLMQEKICLITGANSGIGKVTARELARMGASVVMVCRDRARGEEAQREIREQSGNERVDLLLADLSSQQSISELAETFKQRYTQLHALIHNAGAIFLTRRETVDGLEKTFAVNTLAPFLLTDLLLDTLKASAPSRIVIVSSAAQARGYIQLDDLQSKHHYRAMRVYSQSKLAVTMLTYELARRLEGTGVTVNCLHPGFVATNIAQRDIFPLLRPLVKLVFAMQGISPEEGAKTTIYLASSPEVEGVSGKYFSKSVPRHSAEISYDEALQGRLWEACARLVKAPDGQPSAASG